MKKIIIILCYFLLTSIAFSQDVLYSEKGFIEIQNDDYFFNIGLIENYEQVIKEWDDPDPNKVPGIPAKNTFKQNGNVVPFIAYAILNKNKLANKIYYDIRLVKPNGEISQNKMEELKIKVNSVTVRLMYRANQIYGWGFDETDQKGKYKVIIVIYDTETFKKTIELIFTLE